MILAENGQARVHVYLPPQASEVEHTAATELAAHLEKMSGARFEIRTECENESALPGMYVGYTHAATVNDMVTWDTEEWGFLVKQEQLILNGGKDHSSRGILYAVYHLLEDVFGIHWWTPWEEHIPERHRLEVEDTLYRTGKPKMEYRTLYSINYQKDFLYNARNRQNVINEIIDGGMQPECECYRVAGGALYAGPPFGVHTLGLYAPPEKFFPEHPEWFSWSEALQMRIEQSQNCLTNEGFIAFMQQAIIKNIADTEAKCREQGLEKPVFYSISMNDNTTFCECPACRQLMKTAGKMGYQLHFVNRLARVIKPLFPDARLETLAYFRYIDPPKDGTKPESNVVIRFADMEIDVMHSFAFPGSARSRRLLDQWCDLCKDASLYVWNYYINESPNCPMSTPLSLAEDYQYLSKRGVKGVYIQNGMSVNTNFFALTQYLLMKLDEDPLCDVQALYEQFMEQYYGSAAPYMKAYLETVKKRADITGYRIKVFEPQIDWNYIDLATFETCYALMEQAQKAVAGNAVLEDRMLRERIPIDVCLLGKYNDFVRAAQAQGRAFDYSIQQAYENVCLSTQAYIRHIGLTEEKNAYHWAYLQRMLGLYKRLSQRTVQEYPLPDFLSDVSRQNVYDIALHDISHVDINLWSSYKMRPVPDKDAVSGSALCAVYSEMKPGVQRAFYMSARSDSVRTPFCFHILHEDQPERCFELFREDMSTTEYRWYHVAALDGVTECSNTAIWFPTTAVAAVNLSGIASLFPLGRCDVYVSIKGSGEIYGGQKEEENAISFDRMMIVRR